MKMFNKKLTTIAISALLGMASANVLAKPTDLISNDCKQIFTVQLIGVPGDYTGNCGGGRRIFVSRGANHEHILVENHMHGWHVDWCDATNNAGAILHSDNPGDYIVTIDVTGKPGGEFEIICADVGGTLAVHEHDGALECILEDFTIQKQNGRTRFSILPSDIFDTANEGVVWSIGTNDDFRHAGIRVWDCPI